MLRDRYWFNVFLAGGLAVTLVCGCRTEAGKRKKELGTLRLHMEAHPDAGTQTVPIFRAHPYMITVEKQPFLTEANLEEAKLLDVVGGYSISLKFDRQGTWLLDQYTTANRGRHVAIFCQWDPKPGEKLNQGRWLMAEQISKGITDGMLVFTPDADREEAEQIVTGLSNVGKKLHSSPDSKW